ncbi:cyclic nucleotide-binding domain-containing protein 2-like isoform X1 [Centruroides vittatus]|uniref:cyclic nucleotide-binding domain-containing protein 2-like isoform X1 n=2 Tax=Centruroides vittatus TaxID=120091 RepID=UPI0035104194
MSSKRPLNRFKDIAKFVMHNSDVPHLFEATSIRGTEESSPSHVVRDLDPKVYSRPIEVTRGSISGVVRQLITKESALRTKKDIGMIVGTIRKMPFFVKLDQDLLEKLARVIYYQSLGKGRVIIKEGQIPVYMYYIVDGQVSVSYSERHPITDQIKEIEFTELDKGSYFGEISLMHKTKRELTFTCKVPCQFFVIEDDDFNALLRDIIYIDVVEKRKHLVNMPAFDGIEWNEKQLKIISTFTKIVSFPKERVIVGGIEEQPKDVYFVISGSCKFVRAVKYIIETDEHRKTRYLAFNEKNVSSTCQKRYHKALLEICIVKHGSYFGVGEDMSKTYLLAMDNVACLLIPRSIMLKYGLRKYMEKLCKIHNRIYPLEQRVLDLYFEKKKLQKIQKNIVKKTLMRQKMK